MGVRYTIPGLHRSCSSSVLIGRRSRTTVRASVSPEFLGCSLTALWTRRGATTQQRQEVGLVCSVVCSSSACCDRPNEGNGRICRRITGHRTTGNGSREILGQVYGWKVLRLGRTFSRRRPAWFVRCVDDCYGDDEAAVWASTWADLRVEDDGVERVAVLAGEHLLGFLPEVAGRDVAKRARHLATRRKVVWLMRGIERDEDSYIAWVDFQGKSSEPRASGDARLRQRSPGHSDAP